MATSLISGRLWPNIALGGKDLQSLCGVMQSASASGSGIGAECGRQGVQFAKEEATNTLIQHNDVKCMSVYDG